MDDLKILVDGILNTDAYEKATETSYYSVCPFCEEEIYGGPNYKGMNDIQHASYCLYLKALEIENRDDIQITVTDNNSNEGEIFSFIFNVKEEYYNKLKEIIEEADHEELSIEKTSFTEEEVDLLNKHSGNTYMLRFTFFDKAPDISELTKENVYYDCFYKYG